MRVIGTLPNENEARQFTAYLKAQGIECNCEIVFNQETQHLTYQLWIHNEDEIAPAASALQKFQNDPTNSEFHVSLPPPSPVPSSATATVAQKETVSKKPLTAATHFFLSLCIFVFFLNWIEQQSILSSSSRVIMTPIQEAFFFDLPTNLDQVETENPSLDIQQEEQVLKKLNYWHGAYEWLVNRLQGKASPTDSAPLFDRIRQGEIWRFFTPSLLHGGFLHILFNMIWLWVLGIPIEQRIGFFRTIFLTLALGVGSNTCQYLMGGPFFLGYSGIVVGLAGFIWMRERIAPWEGYPLQRSTILFLILFVVGVFALQFIAFGLQLFTSISFTPNIANTGHISGGLIGMALGRLSFFSRGAQ